MKKAFYIVLWVFLGFILSMILHSFIEIIYLNWADKNDVAINWTLNSSCALPLWLIILLLVLGIVFGTWLGVIAWRKIYVEKVRGDNPRFFSRDK